MESHILEVSNALMAYLQSCHNQSPWWYGIDMDPKDPSSFCRLLGIDPDQYDMLLTSQSFQTRKGICKSKLEEFAVATNKDIERSWHKISGRNYHLLRVGTRYSPLLNSYTPSKQQDDIKKVGAKPPRIDREANIKFLAAWSKYIKALRTAKENNNNDQNKSNKDDNDTMHLPIAVTPNEKYPLSHKNNITMPADVLDKKIDNHNKLKTSTSTTAEEILDVIARRLLKKIFHPDALAQLENMFNTTLSANDILESLAQTTVDLDLDEKRQADVRVEAIKVATGTRTLPVLPSSFPFLSSKSIDVTSSHEVEFVVREVVALQQQVSLLEDINHNIFHCKSHNGRFHSLVKVPSSINDIQFKKNLNKKGGSHWVKSILKAMLPPPSRANEDVDFDEEEGPQVRWTSEQDCAQALTAYVGSKFPAAFISAAEKLGMPVVGAKMDAATSLAMWEDANVYPRNQHIIHKYYIHHFGHKFTVPDGAIRLLAANRVEPITGSTKIGDDDYSWWFKDPLEVITTKLEKIVQYLKKSNNDTTFNKLDIIIGGDHGQKAFRMSVKVILKRGIRNEKIDEFVANIGEVECKKDTAVVLRNTILSKLNERLKLIVKYKTNELDEIISDGTLFVIRKPSMEEYFSFQKPNDPLEILMEAKSVDLRVVVTGDLAFYSTVLGMEGASSSACWLCLLKKKEWDAKPYEKGEKRTMEWIQKNAPTCEQNASRPHGMKEKPLLDAVETCRYIVPPLHTMLGVGNGLLTNFKEFVEQLLEHVPPELKALRIQEMQAEKDWWDKKKDVDEWTSLYGSEVSELTQDIMDLKEIIGYEEEYGHATKEEIKELKAQQPGLKVRMSELKGAKQILLDAVKVPAKKWAAVKKQIKKYCADKRNKYRKPVKSKLERVLRRHGIDYAAYHGGELVGNDIRKMMAAAEIICNDLDAILLEEADESGLSAATKDAVSDRCSAFCHALVCFDSVFSLMFKANEKVNMEVDLPSLKVLVDKALCAWQALKNTNRDGFKNIPPKVHALVQHLADQFEAYGGVGDYDEQFVERSHQTGKKDMYRSRAIRCRENKYKCFAEWEEVRNHPEVMAISKAVNNNRKRKFKVAKDVVSRQKMKQDARVAVRSTMIAQFVPRILASAADLTLKEQELERERQLMTNGDMDSGVNDNDDAGNDDAGQNDDDNRSE